jgi:glycerophosphoryl diester phosphodiesterase
MSSAEHGVVVIAHRGASAHAPEHTFASYDLALELGADVLELDLRLTADGVPVVVHDRTLERTADDPRRVAEVRLAELRRLDPAVRPLSLEQVLARYGDSTRYLLDLKEPSAPVEALVAESVARHRLGARVQVQTFSRPGLRRARRCDPGGSLAQLYPPLTTSARVRWDLVRVAAFAAAIGPHSAAVDAALVQAAHARGLRVQPYTVNDPVEIERLLALGVDALITDAPERVRAALGLRPLLAAAA